ncbi:MAG: hypothetical protein EXQ69_02225 [Acidimicrobiia bacterium]|nr:hypothetical protein [Acidimicrobiia bacterium]
MGSKGSKPRKPTHSQHLPKVGTSTESERLIHEEHQAILDTMGLGNAPSWLKSAFWILGLLMFVGAILGLIYLN